MINKDAPLSDVIYIGEAAIKLGISGDALRVKVQRQVQDKHSDQGIPRPFRLGGRWAWRRVDFDEFLAARARGETV